MSPQWFESFETSPDQQFEEQWIVQLSSAGSAKADNITAAQELLQTHELPVTVLRGLGRPGLLLVASSRGQEETQHLLEDSGIFSEVAMDQSLEAQVNNPPQDTEFLPSQYSFQNTGQFFGTNGADIKAVEAWRNFTDGDDRPGSHEVVVSVIDSGVDYTHPDLARNIWLNQGEIPSELRAQLTDTDSDGLITFVDLVQAPNLPHVTDSNGNGFIDGADLLNDPAWENNVDDDGNGLIDDLIGWDFLNNDNDPIDDHRHGTHVAGTIGAVGDNGFGVAGVNWDVSVMPLKFLNTRLEGSASDAILAINYSAMMRSQFETDVRVINASWGTLGEFNPELQEAFTVAQSAGIVVVAAAGNGDVTGRGIDLDGEGIGFYPASFDLDNIISVAATDNTDSLARFSNFGTTSVDIGAPGVGIIGLNPGGDYVLRTGTSMAAPHVSGTVALLASLRPFATASELRDAILTSTTSLGSLSGKVETGGRLNAETALTVDTFAPRASLAQANDITEDTTNDQLIVVQVNDDTSVDRTTFDSSDLLVRRRGDGAEFDIPLGTAPTSSAAEVFAFYQMPAPGGRWLIEDNGVYEIIVQSGEIADTTGRFNRETVIGSFEVAIQFIGQEPVTTTSDGLIAGSLRSAIQATNAEAGLNTIVLQPGETYTLDVSGADEDAAATGDLDITDELVIRGNGATIQVAGGIDRAFDVLPSGTLTLLDVTITGGNATSGGAVRNAGTATIERSLLTGNSATDGGALSSTGTSTLINTTVSGNTATSGGGIHHTAGLLLLSSVTVTANSATSSGGGIASTANAQLQNTIVGGNTTTGSNPDTSGTFTSNGHNLISILGSAAGFVAGTNGDLIGTSSNPVNALLGELKNNGGLTSTHRLLPNSPAIDAGNNDLAPEVDQRSISRPIDAKRTHSPKTDIGAHERNQVDITGINFRDDNGNGVRDEGEIGLANWTLFLDFNNNEKLDSDEPSTQTSADDPTTFTVDESGTYRFEALPLRDYVVRQQTPSGWDLVTPLDMTPGSIDLSSLDGTTGFRLEGNAAPDQSGFSVSDAGDVNGDGFDDVIIGAYGARVNGAFQAGESYVVFGKSGGFISAMSLDSLDGTNGFRLDGIDGVDKSGISVANAGDVNGDGFDDVIIGAPNGSPLGGGRAGESYVVFGKSGGFSSSIELNRLDGTNGFRLDGINTSDMSGRSVSGAGDVNGDGFDDVIIGAYGGDPSGRYHAGESYVVLGKSSGFSPVVQLDRLDGTNGFVLEGVAPNDRSGIFVSKAGDLNGDGFADVIIGADPDQLYGPRGVSYVVFGKSDGASSTVLLSELDGATGFRLGGSEDVVNSVASAGDVNADGLDDLIIGADATYFLFGRSSGFSSSIDLDSLDGATGFRLTGIGVQSSAGDVNGDGFTDFFVSGPGILFGKPSGLDSTVNAESLNGSSGFRLNGSASSRSSAGDVNRDGFDDILLGAPSADPGGIENAGESYVVFGRSTPVAVPGFGFWNVRPAAGNFATAVDFGNVPQNGSIRGIAFRDLNSNGVRDAGEAGLDRWQLFLDGNNNGQLENGESSTLTDSQGRYEFTDLDPLLDYNIGQVVQAGFEQTFPNPSLGPVQTVTIGAGETVANIDFGNLDTIGGVGLGLGTLEGTYFVDGNGNGEPDSGEGVGGVSLFLDINNSGTRDEVGGELEPVTVTESDGRYLFEELAEGTYTVRALNQQNLQQQFPRSNALSVDDVSVGDFPQSIASGFFNDDNLPDLVVANVFTNDLTLLLNDGSSFSESQSVFAGGLQPQSVSVADFDQNGMDDLVVGYAAGGKISILFGLGNGQFSAPTTIDTGGGGEVNVSTGFFTDDAFPDIAAVSGVSDRAYVIANTTGSNFNILHTLVTGEGPTRAVFANLQQNLAFGPDDNPDLIVSNFIDSQVETFFNNGSGTLTSTSPVTVGIKPTDVAIADFDGDGHLDAAITNQGSDSVTVLFNNGLNGELTSNRRRDYPAGSGPSSVEAVDIDSDGFVDLIVTNGSDSNLAVLRNLGDGVFQSPESFGVALFPLPLAWSVTTADFDLDGDIDLAVAKGKDNQAAVLTNTLTEGAYRVILSDSENVTGLNFQVTAPPVPVISSSETGPTNASAIPITVSFGVEVSNFVQSDLNVGGGSVSGFMTSDNQTWTFNVTPAGDGPITVDIAAGAAQASGGVDSAVAMQFSIVSDRTLPTAMLPDVSPNVRTTPVGNLVVTFSEDVTGVDIDDLQLTRNDRPVDLGALTLNMLDGSQYALDLTSVSGLPGNYELTLKSADSGIADSVGNLFATEVVESWSFEGIGIELDDSFNLLITETSLTGFANNLTLTAVGGDLIISDSNVDLISAVGTNDSSREVRVPLTEISGGQIIATLGGGGDRLDASSLTGLRLTIDGGSGDDTLTGGQLDDTLTGGPGDDTLIVSGNRHLKLLADRSTGAGVDIFTEFELAQLIGGDGNNRLDATSAALPVSLFGGAGNDTLLGSSRPDDSLDGGSGIDRAELTGLNITLTDSNAPRMGTDQAESIEGIQLVGVFPGSAIDASGYSQGSVTIVGSSGPDTLIGSPSDDLVIAASGNDSVIGNGGNDLIFGHRGKDTLNGNSGNDTIFGGAGGDIIDGGLDDDLIVGGAGSDELHGGADQDTIRGNSGHDTVFGNSGNDVLVGSVGRDGLNGGDGNDLLLGQSGSDTLLGFAGNDTLTGGTRSDTLHGGSDDDSLDGGAGEDALHGGSGDNQISTPDEIDETFSESDFPALLEMP